MCLGMKTWNQNVGWRDVRHRPLLLLSRHIGSIPLAPPTLHGWQLLRLLKLHPVLLRRHWREPEITDGWKRRLRRGQTAQSVHSSSSLTHRMENSGLNFGKSNGRQDHKQNSQKTKQSCFVTKKCRNWLRRRRSREGAWCHYSASL